MLIYNNREGADEELLKRFEEPAWNNPVIRYLDEDGADLIPRKDRVWTMGGTSSRMVAALEAGEREVPIWLRLMAAESGEGLDSVTLEMHCFWEGEGRLGALDGVVSTRAGFHAGREVVEVRFDPERIAEQKLIESARQLECAREVLRDVETRDAPLADRKHTLRRTPYRYLPLTPAQSTKVNAALHGGTDPAAFLSPRQRQLLVDVRKALDADPKSLAGLEPPADPARLATYEASLRSRLSD